MQVEYSRIENFFFLFVNTIPEQGDRTSRQDYTKSDSCYLTITSFSSYFFFFFLFHCILNVSSDFSRFRKNYNMLQLFSENVVFITCEDLRSYDGRIVKYASKCPISATVFYYHLSFHAVEQNFLRDGELCLIFYPRFSVQHKI